MDFSANAALSVLETQRANIERVAIETDYNPLYQKLLPVSFSGNPYAPAVVFTSVKTAGEAQWLGNMSDDVPLIGAKDVAAIAPVHTAGIGYSYDFMELGQGAALTADKAKAARQAYEKFVDNAALSGDAKKNLKGLFNLAATDRQRTYDNTTWASGSVADLLALIFEAMNLTGDDGNITANTVLLPASIYSKLASSFVTDTQTGLSVLQSTNPYTMETGAPITIRGFKALETAGTSSTKRIIAYRNNEDSLRLHIPMAHRFIDTFRAGPTRWEVPGIFRLAGLNVVNPKNVAYLDNHSA